MEKKAFLLSLALHFFVFLLLVAKIHPRPTMRQETLQIVPVDIVNVRALTHLLQQKNPPPLNKRDAVVRKAKTPPQIQATKKVPHKKSERLLHIHKKLPVHKKNLRQSIHPNAHLSDKVRSSDSMAKFLNKLLVHKTSVTKSMHKPRKPSIKKSFHPSKTLSLSQIDALKAQIERCWNVPLGAKDLKNIAVVIDFSLNRNGSLAGVPIVVNVKQYEKNTYFSIVANSAIIAVKRCAPFSLPLDKYNAWKKIRLRFHYKDMV